MAGLGKIAFNQVAAVLGVKATKGGVDHDRELATRGVGEAPEKGDRKNLSYAIAPGEVSVVLRQSTFDGISQIQFSGFSKVFHLSEVPCQSTSGSFVTNRNMSE